MSDNDRLAGAQRILKIDAFPTGPDVWRIDWFGPVAFPDRAVRRRQPSVLVRLSKVSPEVYVEGFALHPQLTSDPSNRWVSVGTTVLLRIGDLWRNQSLFMEPSYDTELFEDIEVNDQTTSIIKAGSREADESYVLPMQEHSWHSGNTQSYCVRVRTGQGFDIVVPCMELARHYFGSSSELLSRLFLPPLERASLYEYKYFDGDNSRLFVQLAERMPGTSAEDVARIAQCSQAWKAANMVGASCLRASVGGREIYPQMVFPFEGKTKLAVRGMWLSSGQQPKGTFLVFQILSCWHPFPFQTLRYKTKGQTRKFMPPSESPPAEKRRLPAAPPTEPRLVEQDASANLKATSLSIRTKRRFPDLEGKSVLKSRLLRADGPFPLRAKTAEEVSDVAFGEPDGQGRIREISLQDEAHRVHGRAKPKFVEQLVAALKGLNEHNVELLSVSAEDGWTVPLTLLSDDDGVIEDLLLIKDGEHGQDRPRRACAFYVEGASRRGVIVAIEADPLMPMWYPVNEEEQHDPWLVLYEAASDFVRRWPQVSEADFLIQPSSKDDVYSRLIQWLSTCG